MISLGKTKFSMASCYGIKCVQIKNKTKTKLKVLRWHICWATAFWAFFCLRCINWTESSTSRKNRELSRDSRRDQDFCKTLFRYRDETETFVKWLSETETRPRGEIWTEKYEKSRPRRESRLTLVNVMTRINGEHQCSPYDPGIQKWPFFLFLTPEKK